MSLYIINDEDMLKEKMELINDLINVKTMYESFSRTKSIDQDYAELNCKLEVVPREAAEY